MKTLLIIPFSLLIFSCGPSVPSVVQTGPNSYMVARSSAAGAFADTSKLKMRAIQDANDFAASKGKVATFISAEEKRPVVGGFPSYEYNFKLLDH